ncbi:helix-turn-helix domain-containing protein [uncultured Cohaesibacter sp.]|uniref:helix-turn-helix domain-containing protein n=1 Tax=uncultured Cohaesibacter sp. TaxID=1002546 RepID=UPI002AA85E49|nr:helix-turn-helix domain-containing protein [uncultured Cohaesibacter sp.]
MAVKPLPPLQLTFDALGFGPDMLDKVPHVFKRKKGKGAQQPTACSADPYKLCAFRCQRQLGFRRSYALGEYASFALKYTVLPEGKRFRDFAYCIIAASAVSERYFLKPEEIFVEKRDQIEISGARHIAQHLAVEIGKCSTVMVGQVFDRHHASVRNAVDRVAVLRLASPALEAEVSNLENVVLDLWALADEGESLRKRIALIA